MSQASGNGDCEERTDAGLPRRHVLRTTGAGAGARAGAGALGVGLPG
ncbi:hypothetical protein [Streptomyces sp. NPDC091215]